MIRRYGTPPLRGQRYVMRPGVYVILPRGRDVLLTYQEQPHDEFQLPGGGIDPGEGAIQALHREVLEETGWRIATPRRLGAFRRFAHMPEYDMHAEKLCHIYVARPVRAHGAPTEQGHHAVWMNQTDAAEHLYNSGDRAFLTAWTRFQDGLRA